MPIFTYTCAKCDAVVEQIVSFKDRDEPRSHDGCMGGLVRNTAPELPTLGKPSFQPGVVLGNGKKLAGHFGKDARKGKGWHRP